jgi:hypothetical protein
MAGKQKSKSNKPKKSKTKVVVLAPGVLDWSTFDPKRAAELAKLYAWLAADLIDWQASNVVGTEKPNNCPVVAEIHNEACRKLWAKQVDAVEAAQIATDLLLDNARNVVFYLDATKQTPFVFSLDEIAALTELMMDSRFQPLAPYSPLGAQEMW